MSTTPLPASVRAWLWVVFVTILMMTVIGGITRLTGSGLSMVTWHPLMGALPPLDEAAWNEVFVLYQASPQYEQVNSWMTLADFKRIFFWEYVHRVFGRMIGLIVIGPWLWFLARRQLTRRWAGRTILLFVLGGLQGLMGWFMVRSGLVDMPRVSHFRLAAHLLLAFLCGQYAVWLALDGVPAPSERPAASRAVRLSVMGVIGLVVLQIGFGAFTAGTHAGLVAATFPDVNGHWLPGAFVGEEGVIQAVLYSPAMIAWIHRMLGLLVLAGVIGAVGLWWRSGLVRLRGPGAMLVALTSIQVGLGIATVVWRVPTSLAVIHQATALLLLSSLTWALHRVTR